MGTGGLPPLPAPNAPIPAGVLNRAGRLLPPRRQHHALRQRRRADHQVHRARSPKRDLARSDAGGRAAVLFPSSSPPGSMVDPRAWLVDVITRLPEHRPSASVVPWDWMSPEPQHVAA